MGPGEVRPHIPTPTLYRGHHDQVEATKKNSADGNIYKAHTQQYLRHTYMRNDKNV